MIFSALTLCFFTALADEPSKSGELYRKALVAYDDGDLDKAVELMQKSVAADAKNADARRTLGQLYNHRGSERFKKGEVKGSIEDFDRFLKLNPKEFPGHWKRGISLYYAGRFEDGRKQFEGYEKIDTNDVENAVWHFLCVARKDGAKKARASILKIGKDRRVPMMTVYELFKGKAKPEDVLKIANAGDVEAGQRNRQRFYAHLYLGLYYEAVEKDKKKALVHLAKAADDHKIGHYMWDVAKVHRELISRQLREKGKIKPDKR